MDASQLRRRIIGVLTLGGSFLGIVAGGQQILIGNITGFSAALLVLFSGLFVAGLALGVGIIEGSRRSLALAVPFWAAQIPVLDSPWLSYTFASGASFDVLVGGPGLFNVNWLLGSRFAVQLGTPVQIAIGVNIVAIVILYMVVATREQESYRRL